MASIERTGELLKRELGLENLRFVKISRVALSSYPIYLVHYNSAHPNMPVTNFSIRRWPFTAMVYHGTDLYHGSNRIPAMTPSMDIEDFNGKLRGSLVIPVDLSGHRYIDEDELTKIFESAEKTSTKSVPPSPQVPNRYFWGKLSEFLTIQDLANNAALSSLTQKFRKERTRIMKGENVTAKLADIFIEEGKGTVVFAFLTEATDKYPDDYVYQEVDPETLNLKRNTGEVYEITIEVLDFFDWLDTHPDGQPITQEDIKDILRVSNVKVFSTSPSFHYQGMNYNSSQVDASRYPTDIPPKVWGPRHGGVGEYFVDKHMFGLLRQIGNRGFFLKQMAQQLTSKLKQRGLL